MQTRWIEVVDATPQRHEVGSGKPAADLGSVPLAGEEGVTGKQPVVAPSHEVESLLQGGSGGCGSIGQSFS